jgi:hypothetical protein
MMLGGPDHPTAWPEAARSPAKPPQGRARWPATRRRVAPATRPRLPKARSIPPAEARPGVGDPVRASTAGDRTARAPSTEAGAGAGGRDCAWRDAFGAGKSTGPVAPEGAAGDAGGVLTTGGLGGGSDGAIGATAGAGGRQLS